MHELQNKRRYFVLQARLSRTVAGSEIASFPMSAIYREAAKGDLEGMARIRAAERGDQEGWEKYI
jgi:hypothetical protein